MTRRAARSRSFNVAMLIFVHLLIVLPFAYSLNIWADEASTLYSTQHGFLNALQHAATDEKQAPLYFWIMSLWRSIDGSIFFARLFSVLCNVAAIKIFADVMRRLLDAKAALLASAFFALHPFLMWASVETRVYSMVVLLSILLIRLFLTGFYDEADENLPNNSAVSKLLFLIVSIVALYTNYYLGFLLVGLFVSLLVTSRRREALIYLGLMIAAGAAFAPLILSVRSQFLINTSGFQEAHAVFDGLRYLWHHFLTFLLPAEVFPDENTSTAELIRLWTVRIGLAATVILAIARRNLLSRRTALAGAISLTVFLFLLAAYFIVGSSYIELRHASVAFVPLIFFVTSLIDDISATDAKVPSTISKLATLAIGLAVLISFSYAMLTLYPYGAKRGDWARVGAFIEQNESPGQPIIVFTTFDALALPYHYHGVNRILPDEKFFEFEQEAAFGSADSLKRQTDFVISEIPPDAERIWLAVNEKCLITEACVPLENYVKANYTIEKEQDFYLEKLYLLRKKAQ